MKAAVKTFIGIGGNVADPMQQVLSVLPKLGQINECQLLAHSSLYKTEAISDIKQEDYINAVACLSTTLKPLELLLELQSIEQAYYRQRDKNQKWGPRTMDLDIILFGDLQQHDSHLTIPHPEMQNRLFVLQPLQEISTDLFVPGLGDLDKLVEKAPTMRIQRLQRDNHI